MVQVELPVKDMPTAAELEASLKACDDRVQAERLRRKLRVRRIVGEGKTANVPLWVWRVGDGFFVGQPNEAYTLLQTELRRAFPRSAIAVMNLVNGDWLSRAGRAAGEDLYRSAESLRSRPERVVSNAESRASAMGAR